MTLDTYAALFDDDLDAAGNTLGSLLGGVMGLSRGWRWACIQFRHKKPLTFIFSQGLVELEMGLEPTTYGLQDRCATNCATPAHATD